ncbi:MAG: class I tRNA ligase family protein, partial [Armatimonadota bacterium]|nr:class I tRNA ligase family protein [Armatimonadota bacterium]
IIHCSGCGVVPVAADQLPVLLPDVESYEPGHNGESPLADIPEYVNTTCPKCGTPAKRETDTMGGFACSSWYFLRFCDPHNHKEAFGRGKVDYWMPIDCYVGGAEHAVMHLLYARFWTKALHDAGILNFIEPFATLRNQGMLLAPTPFRAANENETLKVGEVGIMLSYDDAKAMPEDKVFWRWEKMSKSKGNVVTPEEAAVRYGADAIRIYELFEAPFEQTIQWTEERVQGAVRFLNRVHRLVNDYLPRRNAEWRSSLNDITPEETEIRHKVHATIAKVTDDISEFSFNTAVAALMELTNHITDFSRVHEGSSAALDEAVESLILLLSPIAPHSADELWQIIGKEGFTLNESWPKADSKMLTRNEVDIAVQVNGKLRGSVRVPAEIEQRDLERAALDCEKVANALEGITIRKIIVVPGRIVNIVAN